MLSISAMLAKNNVDNFKNRDYREFKVELEQKITDASQRGSEFVFVSIPDTIDKTRMLIEIEESGYSVSVDNLGEYKISWANPDVNDLKI